MKSNKATTPMNYQKTSPDHSISLDELHKIQLSMLKKFVKFCDNHNLTYYLCGGTLLGAIRHKGFIPWDDDIDISMPRRDYEKLREFAKRGQVINNIQILTPSDKDAILPFIKVCDAEYKVAERKRRVNQSQTYAWIDVFPIDTLPDDINASNRLFKKIAFWQHLLGLRTIRGNNRIKELIKSCVRIPLSTFPPHFYSEKIDSIAQSYSHQKTNYVGCAMGMYGTRERMKKADVSKTIRVTFEGCEFSTFVGYDQYLKNLYGDYMTPPPKNQRQAHLVSTLVVENSDKIVE